MNGLPSAFLPPMAHPNRGLNSSAAESLPGPSGATAQTGGFAQAGTDSGATKGSSPKAASSSLSSSPPKAGTFSSLTNQLSSFGFNSGPEPAGGAAMPAGFVPPPEVLGSGWGGGLASSPNVPKPGSSIDPKTGKPHTAGLTRAELDTMRATGHGPLDSAPSMLEGRRLSEMSGREQAARQLTAGLDSGDAGLITPGKELPGGWGPTKQVPVPGSGPNAPTSVYQDITQGLEKVGKGAFGLIPQGIKDALNTEAPVDKGKQPMGSPPKARRSSVGVFFENAKHQAEQIIHDVQDALKDDGRRPSSTTGPVGAQGAAADGGVFKQVKQFLAEAGQAAGNPSRVTSVVGSQHAGPAAPRTSLPSDEVAGALPGEHSTGVGALPGPASEAGVAILPDEKAAPRTLPSDEVAGALPGEHSTGVGALPGPATEAGVAILPDEKKADAAAAAAAAPTENQGLMPGEVSGAGAGTSQSDDVVPTDSNALIVKPDETVVGPVISDEPVRSAEPVRSDEPVSSADEVVPTDTNALIVKPDETVAGPVSSDRAPTPERPTTAGKAIDNVGPAAGLGTALGLAAPLPATHLGEGAADGATDLEAAGLPKSASIVSTPSDVPSMTASTLDSSIATASATRHANERTDSNASVIAIRDGHEGHKPSPLATSTIAERPAVGNGNGVSGAKSLTPGDEADGVGHPSTRAAETTREPGTYPKPDHDGPVTGDRADKSHGHSVTAGAAGAGVAAGLSNKNGDAKHAATTSSTTGSVSDAAPTPSTASNPVTPRTAPTGLENLQPAPGENKADVVAGTKAFESHAVKEPTSPTTTTSPTTASAAATPASPVTKTSAGASTEKGHRRSSSNASSGSNGKKKVGFMNKLKGEIKVIGGKIAHDDKKVQEGERLKHGE